jgi:hypothetical protein
MTDKELVYKHMKALEDSHGYIDVDQVIEKAKSPDHPLHPFFTWSEEDAVQAEKKFVSS